MSTPSTLPPHHPNYGYSHHQNYQSQGGYLGHNSLLNGGSRLGASYNLPTPPSNGSATTASSSIGAPDSSRPTQNMSHSVNAEAQTEATVPASSSMTKQPSKKRQRSTEGRRVDWDNFFGGRNPKEIIVIHDSESPEPAAASIPTNGQSKRGANGVDNRHTAKKRKREDDVGTAYDPVYQLGPDSQTPQYKNSASGSTISTDRTTSAIHTTAATSLGSHSSNGQNGYEYDGAVQTGAKRKRTNTRLQQANEAKRKELEGTGDAYRSYRPPPRPPIKAPDVQVKQIADVSLSEFNSMAGEVDSAAHLWQQPSPLLPLLNIPLTFRRPQDHIYPWISTLLFADANEMDQNSYMKNSKVDDDDGHYIVVQDADLTERCKFKHLQQYSELANIILDQVTKLLGQGTFGKVVQAKDRRRNGKAVAIKIIRSVQKYRDASRIELRVLSTLKANDHENRNRCIHLRDCFDFRGHICIVMDLLGQSVFDFLKGNSFVPFPNSQIQSFARQLFTSVACKFPTSSLEMPS
jgi:dual-specificity kinase